MSIPMPSPIEADDNAHKMELLYVSRRFGMTTKQVAAWNKAGAEGKSIRYESHDWVAMDRKSLERMVLEARIDELKRIDTKYDWTTSESRKVTIGERLLQLIDQLAALDKPVKEDVTNE